MNVSSPSLPERIKQSAQSIVNDLNRSRFADQNIDLQIEYVGILNYTSGVKVRMSFVDSFSDDDVDEWRGIACRRGASGVRTKVDTATGNIDLNIEYKRRPSVQWTWMVRPLMLAFASVSYLQLNQIHAARYPLPW